jgi:hypothetical protein
MAEVRDSGLKTYRLKLENLFRNGLEPVLEKMGRTGALSCIPLLP